MTGFRVRNEHLPVRCEICHQTDLFDPEIGECARCAGISFTTVANTAVSVKVGRGVLRQFFFRRLKILPLLLILAGGISISLFVESIFWTPRTVPTFKPNRFESPIVVNDPVPVISEREDEVELSGMLSETEEKNGARVGRVKGRIVGDGVHGAIGNLFGWHFRVRVGESKITCFCPRVNRFNIAWWRPHGELKQPLSDGHYVYLAGQYDASLDVLFVSRIIIRPSPLRGDELPQS